MAIGQGAGTTVAFTGFTGVCLTDVNNGGKSVAMLDGTCMDSARMIKIANKNVDLGTVTTNLMYDDTVNLDALIGTTGPLTLTDPGGGVETGEATFSSLDKTRPINDMMTATVTFTWTGDDTTTAYSFTPGA